MELKDVRDALTRFWEWVVGIRYWNTLEGWVARVLAWIIAVYIILVFLRHLLEILSKISDSCKALGFSLRRSPTETVKIRRRQQFCKVLSADLATLAKAENWNDQFFTDLEAEVEVEGGYYRSRLQRLLGRKSYGLRRVPSLIQAIESSTEQCLLVTGDPGSGKSVALRHLATQLADIASKSRAADERIPLYVNLKELPRPPLSGPSADFIREFVLEGIRRGDADTAAYVRDNWSEYREAGRWYFLFDSFDEIPDVLHAPTGSAAIRQYADAIRQFFEGMSACRGVLASREFKGPDALAWKKLRILALSQSRQDALIGNAFLLPEQRMIVERHVADSGSAFLRNPLFLTLLCRYVREENKAPVNDNELLVKHIYKLANREPDYLKRKYGLTPEQIIQGSIRLSALFAERSNLSLAPTQDQIAGALAGEKVAGCDLEELLAALIDVKIGRCDVKEARSGDRRFTFSHRRYQETLFVQFLIENPRHLAPTALLTDQRWRDYAVTMLQTAPPKNLQSILDEASTLLEVFAQNHRKDFLSERYGSHLYFFRWDDDPAVGLIELLQEGLVRRIEIVPPKLRESVWKYLGPPWNEGDSFDRLMVLWLGGLLPAAVFEGALRWAIELGTSYHCDAAITNSCFLTSWPHELLRWFRVQLANRLDRGRSRNEILKVEVIAARAPSNVGSAWIITRARRIRNSLPLTAQAVYKLLRVTKWRFYRPSVQFFRVYTLTLPVILVVAAVRLSKVTLVGGGALSIAGACWFARIATNCWLYTFRAVGEPLTLKSVLRECDEIRPQISFFEFMAVLLVIGIFIFITGSLGYLLARWFGYAGSPLMFYLFCPAGCVFVLVGVTTLVIRRGERIAEARFQRAKVSNPKKMPVALQASTWSDVDVWTRNHPDETIPTVTDARSLLRLLDEIMRPHHSLADLLPLGKDIRVGYDLSRRLSNRLIRRVRQLEKLNRPVMQDGADLIGGGNLPDGSHGQLFVRS